MMCGESRPGSADGVADAQRHRRASGRRPARRRRRRAAAGRAGSRSAPAGRCCAAARRSRRAAPRAVPARRCARRQLLTVGSPRRAAAAGTEAARDSPAGCWTGARMSSAAARPSRTKRSISGSPSRVNERRSWRFSAITWLSCSVACARLSATVRRRCEADSTSGLTASITPWALLAEALSSAVAPRSSATRAFRSCTVCGRWLLAASMWLRALATALQVVVAHQPLGALHHLGRRCPPAPADWTGTRRSARAPSGSPGT